MKTLPFIALALAILTGGFAQATQDHAQHHATMPHRSRMSTSHSRRHSSSGGMTAMMQKCDAMCHQMMSDKAAMNARLKEMDLKLQDLQKQMNDVSGDHKIEAISAAVNELISQRIEMDTMMMEMEDKMMKSMTTMADSMSHSGHGGHH